MKKLGILFLCSLLIGASSLRADEGMWLLPLLEKLNIKKMQQAGCKLSAEEIYSINNSSLKDAIVHFGGGCTAEIVSDKGLLFTNHHCGYSSIQKLSSVEHDYLQDGYWAMNLSQELPCKGLSVTFVDKFIDVTEKVEKVLASGKDEKEKEEIFSKLREELYKEATQGDENLDAEIVSFYNNNVYYIITTKTFNDIRFVGAPPSSIGKFGADTDNWMWPRHTGDFSVFRIYADKNNNPADYSPENVPYTPKQSLKISLKGIKEGDYTMIMGFPGRTTRFMTSQEAINTQTVTNAVRINVRTEKQKIWLEDMLADPKVKIQYSSKYSGSSNGWKKWIGMDETFNKLNVIERRKAEEEEFLAWVNSKNSRVKKYGDPVALINNYVKDCTPYSYVATYLSESLGSIELLSASRVGDNRVRFENFLKDYSISTDIKLAKKMIRMYKENVDKEYLPGLYEEIDNKFGGDIDKYVDWLYGASAYTSLEKFNKAVEEGAIKSDPAVKVANEIRALSRAIFAKTREGIDNYEKGKQLYVKGLLEMNGNNASYPDANSTMRFTYGKVMPYSPKDAVIYNYYTTLDGVMQKEDPNNWEFVVPAKLKELWEKREFGEYAMENGKMPVAFLSNNDITGGNSGSPVLNDKGELLGLAFDGNWESMSSDVIFEPELQRCINVDIRYVLFIIDKFGGAGYLLDEMNIVK